MKRSKIILFSVLPVILIAIDQITKWLTRRHFSKKPADVTLIPKVLYFRYVENRGAAWGIMQGRFQILSVVSVILIVGFIYALYKIPKTRRFLPLTLIFLFITAGAVGNLIDRLVFGYVTDFIYFSPINFPVFNVADIYVTCSVAALCIAFLFCYSEEELSFLPFFGAKKPKEAEAEQPKVPDAEQPGEEESK
ncbi:MAG: signal peptidase II [Lachnospiraceae bacterium]|nr:signal peptidase II [Lachnospiraceae bacterium]